MNEELMNFIPNYFQSIWLGIHNMAIDREYKAMNGKIFYQNWNELHNEENRAVSMILNQANLTSVHIEEQQSYMCIYNIKINECDTIHNLCDQVNANCVDTIDSYSCTCHDGFETKDEGRTCTNINECSPDLQNRCGPNTVCYDLEPGLEPGHTCECSPTFAGSPYDTVLGCSKCDDDYTMWKDAFGDGSTCKGKIKY